MKPLTIIKIGGKLLDDELALNQVVTSFSKIDTPKILVHGGGKRASEFCLKWGITPQMINGRRITDQSTLEVVTMVYAGLVNKNLVSQLQASQCNAIGFSGADGNLICAQKRLPGEIDYGFVGDVKRVNICLLSNFLNNGITPVFCAITHDGNGQLLNTNADTIASVLAITLSKQFEVVLKFCFEKEGVLADPMDDTSIISDLSKNDYTRHQQNGTISEGMIPKIDNAFAAKNANVTKVMICGINGILNPKGTEICL